MRNTIERSIKTLDWLSHGVGILCMLALVGSYSWLVLKPLSQRQELCQQRISQLQGMLLKAPEVRKDNVAYRAELASLKQSIEDTQRRLPPELREQEFIDQMRQIAAKSGVEFGAYQMGSITQLASYSQAELTLQCKGSYASICRFLDEIDQIARITEISNLQIEAGDNFHTYPLQVTFVLYFGGSTHDRNMRGEVL
jgi:Tfp pilus assembly protein PilO